MVLSETRLACNEVLAHCRFKSCSNTPVDGKIEGSIDNLQKLHRGDNIEVPDLDVTSVSVVTLDLIVRERERGFILKTVMQLIIIHW